MLKVQQSKFRTPMDKEKDGNIIRIEKFTSEILTVLETFSQSLRNFTLNTKATNYVEIQNKAQEITALTGRLELEKIRHDKLLEEKEELSKTIAIDRNSLLTIENELNEMKSQSVKLSMTKENLQKNLEKMNSNLNSLENQIGIQNKKKIQRGTKVTKKAELYRKYLGIDILPDQNSILKIKFTNFDSKNTTACVLIDFSDEPIVLDLEPNMISIEKTQELFNSSKSFYVFLGTMRECFINYFIKLSQ